MRELCEPQHCEFSPEYCDDTFIEPSGVIFDLTISVLLKVDTCIAEPNYGAYEKIPIEIRDHPCVQHFSTLASLVITGYGTSTNDFNNIFMVEATIDCVQKNDVNKYMDIYVPGAILLVKGRYVLPQTPDEPVLIFAANVLPITSNAINHFEKYFKMIR